MKLGKDNITEINRQMNFYRGNRMRGTDKITMNGFFVRRNIADINYICEVWWEQVKQFSYRDQLSLPFVFEATNRKMENIVRTSEIRRYFNIVRAHTPKADPKPIPNVHHITAGRGDKDIGKAINDIVRGVDDDDWICLRDIDCMPTNHREFFKQCEAIAQTGDYQLVSCMTNRSGLVDQVYTGVDFEDFDMRNHVQAGIDLFEKYGNHVQPTYKSGGRDHADVSEVNLDEGWGF